MNYYENVRHHDFSMKAPAIPTSEKYQVTLWGDPDEVMMTQWQLLSYERWLECEQTRWAEKWRSAWVEQGTGEFDGCVALFTYNDGQQFFNEDNY